MSPSIAVTSGSFVLKRTQPLFIRFQHCRFLGCYAGFCLLHSHAVGERVLRTPFRACDNIASRPPAATQEIRDRGLQTYKKHTSSAPSLDGVFHRGGVGVLLATALAGAKAGVEKLNTCIVSYGVIVLCAPCARMAQTKGRERAAKKNEVRKTHETTHVANTPKIIQTATFWRHEDDYA